LALLPAGTGFGCDWTVELAALRRRLGPSVALQGNLDPAWLLTTPQAIRRATFQLLDSMTGDAAYIANLGHGLHPQTPEANVHAFAKAVREWEPRV
jgi:uroporphyrinogen decarboxylase